MREVRKLIQLNPSTHAVTLPKRLIKHLQVEKGDLIEVLLYDKKSLLIKKLTL